MNVLARAIEAGLRARRDAVRAEQEKRYLKSSLEHLGVGATGLRQVVREATAGRKLDRESLLEVTGALWARPVHECRAAAIDLLMRKCKLLEPADLPMLEQMLRESKTWAYVDALAVHVVGPIVAPHANLLDRWARDPDFWIRRSAMLALLLPLRRGEHGELPRFLRYADSMLDEKEFFIRKAVGWILRETGRKRPEVVLEFIEPRIARVSGVTLREAVKPLSEHDRKRLLAAYRER